MLLVFLKCCFGIMIFLFHFGHRAWVIFSLHAFMRWVDDTIDGDWAIPQGMSLDSYLAQKDLLFKSLREKDFRMMLRSEDIFLVCIIREGERCGFNFSLQLQQMWEWYRSDVDRQQQKYSLLSFDMLDSPAAKANIEFFMIAFSVLGGNPQNSRNIIEEAVTLFMVSDVLNDLVDDLCKGIVWLPRQSLERHQVSIEELLKCRSWKQVTQIPGMAAWYCAEVRYIRQRWNTLYATLPKDMEPLLPNPIVRRRFIRGTFKEFEFFIRKCEGRLSLFNE